MKNIFILSIALLVSAPAMAMEGQWSKEEVPAPALKEEKSTVPSLANLCLNVLEDQTIIEDPQFLLDLPDKIKLLGERYATFVWKNATQKIIDVYNDELVEQLFNIDYPAATKAIMAERLTLTDTQAQKLFESVIDSNNEQPNKHLIVCALFVKYPQLQTWENGKKIAELGPITYEVAKAIVKTIKTMGNLYELYIANAKESSGLPEQMLNFGNDELFAQAFYDLCLSKHISVAAQPPSIPIETFNFDASYDYNAPPPTEHEHSYSIFTDQSGIKALHDENGDFVCYLPQSTKNIAISNDKKWCICCTLNGKLTIINLEEKSIIAKMDGRLEFGRLGIYFDKNNQLCGNGTSINLPYSYLENTMPLFQVISVILQKNGWELPKKERFNYNGEIWFLLEKDKQQSCLLEDQAQDKQ